MVFGVKYTQICVILIKKDQFAVKCLDVRFVFFFFDIVDEDSVLGNDNEEIFA